MKYNTNKNFEQLHEDAIKLQYLEKCYKNRKRRDEIQKMEANINLIKIQKLQKNFHSKHLIFIIKLMEKKNQKNLYISTNEKLW